MSEPEDVTGVVGGERGYGARARGYGVKARGYGSLEIILSFPWTGGRGTLYFHPHFPFPIHIHISIPNPSYSL